MVDGKREGNYNNDGCSPYTTLLLITTDKAYDIAKDGARSRLWQMTNKVRKSKIAFFL